MPTYDYRCEACGHEFEAFQSMTARPLKKCPECEQRKLKRLIGTGAGIIFKGSGFYETDYRSDSYKKAAEAEKSGGSESKTEKKSDSKSTETSKTNAKDGASKTSGESGKKSGENKSAA